MSVSEGRTALLAGATGLVGRHCLDALLASPAFGRIIALVRRPVARNAPRLEMRTVDFAHLQAVGRIQASDAFCALGTTIAAAGSREAFERVDFDYLVAFAQLARVGGVTPFMLVSSVGASARSSNFYLRVKGRAEEAVGLLGFDQLDVLRPGLLIGPRNERRTAEAMAQRLLPPVGILMAGPLRKYRAVAASVVGAAMVGTALAEHRGVTVLHYDDIVRRAEHLDLAPRS
jgi:uncharacterized protein YbjT (DUF2867 family)